MTKIQILTKQIFMVFAALLLPPLSVLHAVEVQGLRCEYLVNPMGVDAPRPRLSWQLKSDERGERQTAYRVIVDDVWDSGKVESDQSVGVVYAGKELESSRKYAWKVMVWDKAGQPSPWSAPATFATGKLKAGDWHGVWIGAPKIAWPAPDAGPLGFAVEARQADAVKWVQVDLGTAQPIERVVLHPQLHSENDARGLIAGYGFPLRFRVALSEDPEFKTFTTIADQSAADFPNPGQTPVVFEAGGKQARYIRLTALKLWPRGPNLPHVMTLAELEVFAGGKNVALHQPVTASDSVECCGWGKSHLTDGCGVAVTAAPPQSGDEGLTELRKFPYAPILLRKEFTVAKPVKRATVFFCGLGWSELFIAGQRVGDYVMGPGPTTYDKRVQYLTFDVTSRFTQPGPKTLDVTLYDGWYALERDPWVHQFHTKPYVDRPKLLLDLRLEHDDGTETIVKSDESWRWSLGPIRRAWICEEEDDFRVTPGPWQPVALLAAPAGRLAAQREPPTHIVETLRPVSLTETNGAWTFQFGREFTGFVALRTAGPAGTTVKLTTFPAKLAPRNFSFILKGEDVEEFAPRETYTAIAKVTVRGLAKTPVLADLTGNRITGVGAVASAFSCSDETINWIHESARRTQANYVTFLPNDPTREFKAWTQDIQNMFWSAMYLFDSQAMYERWQYDMLDTQSADGNLPNVAPGPVYDPYNSPWWGGCGVWLPWEMYLWTGDDRLLRESYDGMKRYVDFLATQARDGLQDWGLTDWLAWESTPRPIVNTPAAFHFAQIVSRAAKMTGHQDDAEQYRRKAEEIRDNFNARFLDPETGIYGVPGGKPDVEGSGKHTYPPLRHETWWTGNRVCTQTGQALPLALGMVPENIRPLAERALLREIAAHNNHISAGFIGTPYLLRVLEDLAPAVGHSMTTQRDFPSWYWMTKGAGCDQMMETWNGGQAFMPSLGGNIVAWNIEALAGIRPDPAGPGFKKIIIKPAVVGELRWVECWYDSPHGRIVSIWRRDGTKLTMDITIPANTTATIFVPGEPPRDVGSGNHQFTCEFRTGDPGVAR